MKTLQQIKDCQAIDLGYNSFSDLVLNPKRDMKMNHLNWCIERSMEEYKYQHVKALEAELDRLKAGVSKLIEINERSSARYKACFEKDNTNGHKVFDMFAGELKSILNPLKTAKQ